MNDKRELCNDLTEYIAKVLHIIELNEQGIMEPTKEQSDGWKNKYKGITGVNTLWYEQLIINLFRKKVEYMTSGILNIIDKSLAQGEWICHDCGRITLIGNTHSVSLGDGISKYVCEECYSDDLNRRREMLSHEK